MSTPHPEGLGAELAMRGALERAGVDQSDVQVGSAVVEYNESKVTHEQIVEAIEDAGFEVAA